MIEIEARDPAWRRALPGVVGIAREAAGAAAKAAPRTGFEGGHVTILLTDDETVRGLNARFRDKDATTNVLAFPSVANLEDHLGDIAVAFGVCAREAEARAKTLADHMRHLVVHGVLHLMGYDHQDDASATRMEALERDVLAKLGVADPYDRKDHVEHGQ